MLKIVDIKITDSAHIFDVLTTTGSITNAIKKGMATGWYNFGDFLVRKAKDAIQKDIKTGKIYKLYGQLAIKSGKTIHQASAPGESPANLTGDLVRGIHNRLISDGVEWGYDASTPYGKYLEFGAKGPGSRKMLKRPNIIPISKKSDVTAGIIFNESIASELSKL
jgi:nucleoid DNA-binding protein